MQVNIEFGAYKDNNNVRNIKMYDHTSEYDTQQYSAPHKKQQKVSLTRVYNDLDLPTAIRLPRTDQKLIKAPTSN